MQSNRGPFKKRPRLPVDEQQVKIRLWLWFVAAVTILLAILLTADLLDGASSILWHRRATIWDEPALFAASAGVDLVCIALASLLWIAAIGDWNEQWLPASLRRKPLTMLAVLSLVTIGAVYFGVELLRGDLTLRHLGHVTADGTPFRYAWATFCYLAFCAFMALGWYALWHSWKYPRGERWQPPLDEPEKRSPMEPQTGPSADAPGE